MSHTPRPRPTPADSVPIRLNRSAAAPRPPEAPRSEEPRPAARQAGPPARPARTLPAGIEPMLGIDDLAMLLSCSRRLIERMRSAGRVPKPDIQIGKMPRWKAETIRGWIERGGKA